MTVELGGFGFACQFAQLLTEYLLVVNVDILVAEEDDASFGDLRGLVQYKKTVVTPG